MSLSRRSRKLGLGLFPLFILAQQAQAWNASLSADYSSPFVQGDPSMSLGVSCAEDFSKKWGVSLVQGFEKNLYVDSSTKEWELSDSALGLNLYPRTLIPDVSWTLRLQMTLPTSHISQVNEVYSKPEVRLYSSYPLTETFSFGLNAFARATLSRYETAAVQDGLGGAPLPQYSYGFAQNGSWRFIPDWSFIYGLSYTEILYHSVSYDGIGDAPIYKQPDQAYSLSTAINWAIDQHHAVSGSYSYGSILLQSGLDDYVLYDEQDSRWSVGYSYSF